MSDIAMFIAVWATAWIVVGLLWEWSCPSRYSDENYWSYGLTNVLAWPAWLAFWIAGLVFSLIAVVIVLVSRCFNGGFHGEAYLRRWPLRSLRRVASENKGTG